MSERSSLRRAAWIAVFMGMGVVPFAAQGAFPQGSIAVSATADDILRFFGTTKVKMVFVVDSVSLSGNYNEIYYLDYSTVTGTNKPAIVKAPTQRGSLLPVISPDGSMFTFARDVIADGTESGRGSAWICRFADNAVFKVADTAFVPRFVQNSDRPEIIYGTCADVTRADSIEFCGKTTRREVLGNAGGASRMAFNVGSYYGGLSYDGNYLATAWLAGPSARMIDLRTSDRQIVHKLFVKNKTTGVDTIVNSIGCCNPSISSSRIFTSAMMYFDFGSGVIVNSGCYHPVLGTWGLHHRIFVSRFPGEVLRYYDMPRDPVVAPPVAGVGERNAQEWNYPEWSNHPYYSAAALQFSRIWKKTTGVGYDRRIRSEQIYAMSLKDSLYLKVLQMVDSSKTFPFDIKWPWLWVELPPGFQEDPAWLAQTVEQRAGIGVKWKRSGNRVGADIRFDGGIVTSLNGLSEISVHNALGACLRVLPIDSRTTTASVHGLFPGLDRGIYFVKVRTRTGAHATFRWSLSN